MMLPLKKTHQTPSMGRWWGWAQGWNNNHLYIPGAPSWPLFWRSGPPKTALNGPIWGLQVYLYTLPCTLQKQKAIKKKMVFGCFFSKPKIHIKFEGKGTREHVGTIWDLSKTFWAMDVGKLMATSPWPVCHKRFRMAFGRPMDWSMILMPQKSTNSRKLTWNPENPRLEDYFPLERGDF